MADTTAANPDAAAPAVAEQAPVAEPVAAPAGGETAEDAKPSTEATKEETEKPQDTTETEAAAADKGDVEMNDAAEAAPAAAASRTPNAKNKGGRRKSAGGGLNRKGSKARLTHTDAKPGDHFLLKLKGFPPWPVIIADEDMIPDALFNTRPVSAAKQDGSYNEAYAEGGKRVNDRTFPVMFLHTNEFAWAANTAFTEIDEDEAMERSENEKLRKDLREAYLLRAGNKQLNYYKDLLERFDKELKAEQQALEEAEEAKRAAAAAAAATPKKGKKSKKTDEDDVDMDDGESSAKPKSKKRKAEDETSTPQRSDSVKKPKIKLNTSSTPKANGTPSKKAESATKPKSDKKAAKKAPEPEMTPAEKRERKQKEVFFLRHKLQRGLLSKDTPPVESEMKSMSDYLTHLESFADLEASIIRETKINKVLKAILKMESVPCEEEFTFKKRSQGLLDKWGKLLANAAATAPAGNTNGVNGTNAKKDTNGTSEGAEAKPTSDKPAEEKKTEEPSEPVKAEEKGPEAVAA